jgi:uncharacterized protein (DUF1778 family)
MSVGLTRGFAGQPSRVFPQVNICLTPEEKTMIASAAAKAGFKGLADFIRTTALDRTFFNR